MSTIVLGCDSNGSDTKYQNTIAKGLEDAGYSVEKLEVGPNPYANYTYGKNGKNPKGKVGVYLMAGSLVSVTDAYESSPGFDYNYFVIRGDESRRFKSQNDFNTKGVNKDPDGSYSGKYYDAWAGKTYVEINDLAKDKCKCVFASNAEEGVDALLNAISGISPDNSSNDNNENDDDEDWDDKDNFTPHKGRIMEIRPYKEISSVSFDKSYDSPTGTGKVELVYSAKDYKFLYKGVAMKLKLRRSCDAQWSATGLEEPDYDENEKFIKEHIPTNELLKELGLPNYRKQGGVLMNTNTDVTDVDSGSSSSTNTSNNTSGSSSSSSSSSGRTNTSVNKTPSNRSNSSSKTLTRSYINSLSPAQAKKLAESKNYDAATLKALRRRGLGLYW